MTRTSGLLNGKPLAEKMLSETAKKIALLKKAGAVLSLATVQVGGAKDTVLYSSALEKLLRSVGVEYLPSVSPQDISEPALCEKILALNNDATVTGIMVFSPLPPGLNASSVLNAMDPLKDVEGRTFMKSHFGVFSPTANAVMALLGESGMELVGKEARVVGHSALVGKPAAILLMDAMATVTVCHAKTVGLKQKVAAADILVAAAGKPNLIKGEWIKRGAVVIDVGENFLNGKLVGDVEFDKAKERASLISPVPGGVGPLTNVMMIQNLLKIHSLKAASKWKSLNS